MYFFILLLGFVLFSSILWNVLHRLSESTDRWQRLAGRMNKIETEWKILVERVHVMEARLKELAQQPAARPQETPAEQLPAPAMQPTPVPTSPPPTPVIPPVAARIEAPAPTAAHLMVSQPKPEMQPPPVPVSPPNGPEPVKSETTAAINAPATPPAPEHPPASKPPAVIPPAHVVPPPTETPRHVIQLKTPRPESPKPPAPAKPLPPPSVPPAPKAHRPSYPLISEPARPARPALGTRLKALLNLEEVLGTNYLSKLGVIFVVIGMSLYLGYQLQRQGPVVRVALGCSVSFLMLGAGIVFERRERYRVLARAGIGGGWALLFFMSYAMGHVDAVLVIRSQPLDFILMLAVATAMVAHTLKYRSQVVTGMAFFLAFATVSINRVDVYSLFANALLAAALVVIVWRLAWYELEVFGILVAFLTHFYWLLPIVQNMGSQRTKFPEYAMSGALLIFYWLAFRISYVIRLPRDKRGENISTAAALLNTGLLIGVSGYQSLRIPIDALWFFLAIGAADLALGRLVKSRRRTAFIVLTTLGATLMTAAYPFYFTTPSNLSVIWLAEAEAFFLVGVLVREIVYRRIGMLALALTSLQMLIVHSAGVLPVRLIYSQAAAEPGLALLFGIGAAVLYLNSNTLARRRPELIETAIEKVCFPWFSYLAGVFAGLAVWMAWPHQGAAVAWSALALVTAWFGRRWSMRELSLQGHFFAAASFLRLLIVNLRTAASLHSHENWRLATVICGAALLYAASRYAGPAQEKHKRGFATGYTWAASILLALLGWYELRVEYIAPAWILFALMLALAARRLKLRELSHQSHALSLAAFTGGLSFNLIGLSGASTHQHMALRLVTVAIIFVLFYACSHLERTAERGSGKVAAIYTWAATTLVALLLWYELPVGFVAPAWMLLAVAVAIVSRRLKLREFSDQMHAVTAAALTAVFYFNLTAASAHQHSWLRLVTVGVVFALTYACSGFARTSEFVSVRALAPIYTWAGTAVLSALLWYELPAEYVSPAWMLLAFLLALVGRRLKLRELTYQIHALAAASIIAAMGYNLLGAASYHEWHVRLVAVPVAVTAALLYACSHWTRISETTAAGTISGLYTWEASALLGTLLWHELPADWAAPAWMLLAVALAVAGRRLKLVALSYQANCLALAAFMGAVLVNLVLTQGPGHHLILRQFLTVALVAALLYVCAWCAKASNVVEASFIGELHTWAATLLAGLLSWYECPAEWAPVVWCAMALALTVLSSFWNRRDFAWQANCLSSVALIRLIFFNLGSTGIGHHLLVRLVTVSISAALFYLSALWSSATEGTRRWRIPQAYTWAGSTLVFLLAWYELNPMSVAVAWMLLGLILFELSLERKSPSLRLQAYSALTASFVRLFFANLGKGAPSVYTTLPVAVALFYVYWRMKSRPEESVRVLKWRVRASDYYGFIAATAVAALLRADLRDIWVVAGWAGLVVLLLALAHFEKQAVFLIEALILGAGIFYRAIMFNFYQRSYFARGFLDGGLAPVAVTVVLLFLSLAFAFKLRSTATGEGAERKRLRRLLAIIYRQPDQFLFYVLVALLTALLWLQFGSSMATLAWGVEAVALFLFALSVGRRSYRLTGLALLLVCAGKIAAWDAWQLSGSNRYLTLIGVGVALVVVSTLYTRYREALRRYL